jgi:CO dehydrogenase maturation factor
MMKVAITGKGGVGKTTLASLLARVYAAEGKAVLAIDANPDANLSMALGIPPEEVRKIIPISEMNDLIEERTGAKPGSSAPYFKLNPQVDDIPERFSAKIDGIRLLLMGTVKSAGSGCMCPESALLRSLMAHLLFRESDVVIMDMDAGMEHIGRGTAQGVDAFIIVVEPGKRSVQTAEAIDKLAQELKVSCYVVGSKVTSDADRQFIIDSLPRFEVLGFMSYNAKVREADLKGMSVYDAAPDVVEEVKTIKQKLEQKEAERSI